MMKRKVIAIVGLFLVLSLVGVILFSYGYNDSVGIMGKWNSVDGTLIKIIKEYKDGKAIYVDDNIIKYQLEIKKRNKYILYYSVIDEMSNDSNIMESGRYNIDLDSKGIIYFDSEIGNDSYIWKCRLGDNKLYDCDNYAIEFVR